MKKLLLILSIAFFSSTSLAKIGDAYMCNMTAYLSTEIWWTGEVVKKELETFSFKREKDSHGDDSITITPFGDDGGFSSGYFRVTGTYGVENFIAEGYRVLMTYDNYHHEDDEIREYGWFNWVLLYPKGMESVLARCKIIDEGLY